MASSITLQGTLLKSHVLGQTTHFNCPNSQRPHSLIPKESKFKLKPCAKFNLFELLGGRGLCNGEQGIQKELTKEVDESGSPAQDENSSTMEASSTGDVPEDAFEKELMGLTGGFPGGEKGLQKFIEENPPPKKQPGSGSGDTSAILELAASKKPKPPELPM